MYYNEYGEMIQRRSTNIMGGNDDDYIQYNHLTGKELTHKHIHSSFPQTSHTEIYTYTYDTADQLTSVKHKFDNNAQVTLYSLEYDNIGRVSSKALMNNAETVSYCYNIRDWLTGLSSTNYSESLSYYNSPNQSFNGNISRFMWHLTSSSATRGYDFVYDNLDRLTSATYGESESLQTNRNRYSTSYTYDKNGNILTLTRKGLQDGGSYGFIDNLSFTYTGNQVTRIEDSSNDPTYNGAFNFVDGASQTNEYTYDANGNMTKDLNKNILSIQYNLLNLPQNMSFGNGNTAEYAYNAAGERLSTSYGNLTSGVTFYNSANYFYTYGAISNILIDGGYITLSGSTPVYHYYLKDHLGSNRVVCNASGTVEQANHYYPFGGLFGESTNASTQKYKYNGKEYDRVHGLDWYDYGARFMNPDMGRFTTIDPMAEKYYSISPYAYCANNPVRYIDPDGNKIRIYKKNQKQVLNYINKLAQGTFAVDKKGYLFLVKKSNTKGYSKTYTESLVRAIDNMKKTINIYVDNYYIDENNNRQDISQKGEGTTKEYYNGEIVVVISGKSYNKLTDRDGNSISDKPEYILAHEIAGHAEPRLNNKGKENVVNAVNIENAIRRETNEKERKEEPNHVQ